MAQNLVAGISSLVLVAISSTLPATADQVALGSSYFHTPSTIIDFGGSIGPVNLVGNAIGPGNTDTIIERQADAIINGPAIPLQLRALSLTSSAPINIGGTFFNVVVMLDPANIDKDRGTMSVAGTPTQGTFDAFLNAFIVAQFHATGNEDTVSVEEAISLNFTKVEFRNLGFTNDAVQVLGFECDSPSCSPAQLAVDRAANVHTGLSSDEGDFYPPDATVPIPPGLPLFATGLGVLGLLGWRRNRYALLLRRRPS